MNPPVKVGTAIGLNSGRVGIGSPLFEEQGLARMEDVEGGDFSRE